MRQRIALETITRFARRSRARSHDRRRENANRTRPRVTRVSSRTRDHARRSRVRARVRVYRSLNPFRPAAALCYIIAMSNAPRILAFGGSLRRDSLNKKLVMIAAAGARAAGAEVTLLDLRDIPMPIYDGDLEHRDGL